MARLLDFISGPWQALWYGLENHEEWAKIITEKNRIKFSPGEATVTKKTFVDPASFPRAMIIPVDLVDDMYIGSETFATQHEDFDPATSEWLETININYLITINSRSITIGEMDVIGVYTLEAIRKLGPKLGLDYVSTVGKISMTSKEADRNKSTYRWDFFFKVPVVVQIEGQKLV